MTAACGGGATSVAAADGRADPMQPQPRSSAARILDALDAHICVIDATGTILTVNRRWRDHAAGARDPARLLEGGNYLQACEAAVGANREPALRLAAAMRRMIAGDISSHYLDYPVHSRRGQRWFATRVTRVQGSDAPVLVISHQDITARKSAEQARDEQARQQHLVAIFGQKALATRDIDELFAQVPALVIEGLRADWCSMAEVAADRQSIAFRVGTDWLNGGSMKLSKSSVERTFSSGKPFVFDDVADDDRSHAAEIARQHGIRSGIRVPLAGSSGIYGVLCAYSRRRAAFSAQDADFLQSVATIIENALVRQSSDERNTRLARFDPLTQLPNRTVFRERLAKAVLHASTTSRCRLAVLFVDLDGFKFVNDTYGHHTGDRLLALAAQRLGECVRGGDTVARLGGDEFGIITTGASDASGTTIGSGLARRIIDALAVPFELGGQEAFVSASIGVATFPDDGMDVDTLINNADTAMYRAKDAGRNGYQLYAPEMSEQAAGRVRYGTQLRRALERREFVLHFQPKVHAADGTLSGLEALLRWQHPERGLVGPADFIPVLEDTGLIAPVGEWVLREACEQARRWHDAGLLSVPIAVNVSARQFRHQNFESGVHGILRATGIDPTLLELELTESALMTNPDQAVRILAALKAVGVRVSIDDFGTGYSSLAYLSRFPVDALKIDRTFIQQAVGEQVNESIIVAIIHLAKALRLRVVAEGVETAAQLRLVVRHGCDECQGYYFSRPLTVDACTGFLRDARRGKRPPDAGRPANRTVASKPGEPCSVAVTASAAPHR